LFGGGLLYCLSLTSLFGIGFSSWLIAGETDSSDIAESLNVDVGGIVYTFGSSLKLNTAKGTEGKGVDNLEYCNSGSATGLVHDGEIGSKGSVKFYFYLLISQFKQSKGYSSISPSFVLSYAADISDTSKFTLLNADTTASLDYYYADSIAATSSSPSDGALTSSYSDNAYSSSMGSSISLNTSRTLLLFELEYTFTVSDVSSVLSNECSYSGGSLFNLAIKLNDGGAS